MCKTKEEEACLPTNDVPVFKDPRCLLHCPIFSVIWVNRPFKTTVNKSTETDSSVGSSRYRSFETLV